MWDHVLKFTMEMKMWTSSMRIKPGIKADDKQSETINNELQGDITKILDEDPGARVFVII